MTKMIEKIRLDALKTEFEKFKSSNNYEFRKKQLAFTSIAQQTLKELTKRSKISNEDLTSLIQIFKAGCSKGTFLKYLKRLKLPKRKEKAIYEEFSNLSKKDCTGYTGMGKATIKGLNQKQLKTVLILLKSVSKSKNKEEIKKAVRKFQSENIPQVKVGIYSPWLYYLQPTICPLVTGPIRDFLKRLGWEDEDYIEAIDFFEKINEAIGERDLGFFDAFLWSKKRINAILKKKPINKSNLFDILNSINTKPFIILSGISGTGKTQIARIISAVIVNEEKKNKKGEQDGVR